MLGDRGKGLWLPVQRFRLYWAILRSIKKKDWLQATTTYQEFLRAFKLTACIAVEECLIFGAEQRVAAMEELGLKSIHGAGMRPPVAGDPEWKHTHKDMYEAAKGRKELPDDMSWPPRFEDYPFISYDGLLKSECDKVIFMHHVFAPLVPLV